MNSQWIYGGDCSICRRKDYCTLVEEKGGCIPRRKRVRQITEKLEAGLTLEEIGITKEDLINFGIKYPESK